MGITLCFLTLVLIIVGATTYSRWHNWYGREHRFRDAFWHVDNMFALCLFLGFWLATLAIGIGFSYSSYLDARSYYDGVIAQYSGAIEMYQDKAVLNLSKVQDMALTDLKYQGYQENLADMIKDLRQQVADYDDIIIRKRIMKKNFFVGWYIITPDSDMKIINIWVGGKK